jgi:penicillin-binding protein 2
MLNRPVRLRELGTAPTRAVTGSDARLGVLFGGFAIVVAIIALRALWLQTSGQSRFTSLWDRTQQRVESIPARDGRIVTSDGVVLAVDETEFSIALHYRWLENPPDPDWLKSQALAQLDRADRRNAERVEAATQDVLRRREQMHQDLAKLLQVSPEALAERMSLIQNRVERVVAAVEARQLTREQSASHPPASPVAGSTWVRLWETVCRELTTPPHRTVREPLVVAEELEYHPIAVAVGVDAVGLVESAPSSFPGVRVEIQSRRTYPRGDQASHLVGSRRPLTEAEFEERRSNIDPSGYSASDRLGRTGIERACDAQLHGLRGEHEIVTNRAGEILSDTIVRTPRHGADVTLTIDSRLQTVAEQLLDDVLSGEAVADTEVAQTAPEGEPGIAGRPVGGCLVAIDVRTGEILTAASAPRHDASLLISATQAEWDALANDPRRPFFPRVTQATLPPGSVFKVLTAIAALESGVLAPDERFDCQGYFERPDRERCAIYRHFGVGHGPVDLSTALAESCNVYFFDVAGRVGGDRIADWANRFGLGTPTGAELPGEASGAVPSPAASARNREPWYPGTTRQLAVGQGALTVTPLQVARLMAAIANDGWLVTPQFVRRPGATRSESLTSSDIQLVGFNVGSEADEKSAAVRVEGLSTATLAAVRAGLEQAVEHPRGTGRAARLDDVRIAGKTGTAQIGAGRPDHAWFAGYVPAESPRIAFVVVIEEGGSGGSVAAPIAREYVRSLLETGLVPRSTRRKTINPSQIHSGGEPPSSKGAGCAAGS